MAASDKKVHQYTSFNAGEYSPELAGRVDLESFNSSTRQMTNMLSQISGGVKKFYGTTHVAEVTPDAGKTNVKFIPFINSYEPIVLVVWGRDEATEAADELKVGLIYGDNYKPLTDVAFPSSVEVEKLRWKQINDVIIFAHESTQPFSVKFYGQDKVNGGYIFQAENIKFKEIPYFPIDTTEDYVGTLESTGVSGTVTMSIPNLAMSVRTNFPAILTDQSVYVRTGRPGHTTWTPTGYPTNEKGHTVDNSVVKLYRRRNGVDTELCSGVCNQVTQNDEHTDSNGHHYRVTDQISRERICQVIEATYPGSYLHADQIILNNVGGHQNGDEYYLKLEVGKIVYLRYNSTTFPAVTYTSVPYEPAYVRIENYKPEEWIGRKIKFYFNDKTEVLPWWQGRSVSQGDYAYSNGHWYKAETAGTCGNIQPSHTFGIRYDGDPGANPPGVAWLYVHSGSNTATVVNVDTLTNSFTALVESGELPNNTNNGVNTYENYAWSIWGKDGVHPSDVYMVGNRLGFVCNTAGYGAWNALSVTDDYYNFSTEEYGEQLDTSAIVHLIGNNESGAINWVLSRKNVYMGSYSGEYNIKGGTNNVLTPTQTVVENISNMGGKSVVPLKYKELNMFVGATGKELYTISYDYTIEDYTPHSLGYLTQHIMEKGVRRIEALNNMDRNIYLLHDTNEMSLFNFAREQKVMGFSELSFGSPVLDFVTTYSNDVVAGYVAVVRNNGKITFERLAIANPTYMFDVITTGNGTLADFTAIPHLANKDVWIRYGEDMSQFARDTLDANGEPTIILPQSKYFKVGIPMISEIRTQPAFGQKVEGHQQQSIYISIRLNKSGAFDYGSSVDFTKYFHYDY